ncbi:glycosyltransferase [Paenibacillus polymyxa]|uniref:glycosyltransferase n=1 Tax=Paenibacillus polymyxa TaxID=1406 RepID=UPI0021E3BB01|nr:glycosyltransferase [Paenibacillus polymyxa]
MNDFVAESKPRLVALWPECLNVFLTKDLGMIPFILHKYHNYDSAIACYGIEDFPYIETEVKGLKIDSVENNGDILTDGNNYLTKKAKEIDILFLMGIYPFTLSWMEKYKSVNPKGKIYLKLDANIYWMNSIDLTENLFETLKKSDVISVESRRLYHYLNKKWPLKIEYIPNGFYNFHSSPSVDFSEKENVILTVGRIGTHQKANETMLEAFKLAASEIPDWKLKLVGNVEEQFIEYVHGFFTENPELRDRVELVGSIENRKVIENEYRQAKIFCLTSRYEGFPLVFTEAAKNGCFIVSTELDPAFDITNESAFGTLFPIDDYYRLSELLIEVCNDSIRLEQTCCEIQNFAETNFNWTNICDKLDLLLHLN